VLTGDSTPRTPFAAWTNHKEIPVSSQLIAHLVAENKRLQLEVFRLLGQLQSTSQLQTAAVDGWREVYDKNAVLEEVNRDLRQQIFELKNPHVRDTIPITELNGAAH
jgi:hypothetical protein